MAECDVGLYHEKLCKFTYCSWCAGCERTSPKRRRSKSENGEICKRKMRETKTLTPKKYYNKKEYENMEMEGCREERYDCCRVRSNLCELPTSYITNNHQLNVKCDKNVTKIVTGPNGGIMHDKQKIDTVNRITNSDLEYWRNLGSKLNKTRVYYDHMKPFNKNCKEYCPLVDFKHHNLSNRKTVCYDTATFFDKSESVKIPDYYSSEIEYLREKLRILRDNCHAYCKSQEEKNASVKNYVRREKRIISSPLVKGRTKLTLKVKSRGSSSRCPVNKGRVGANNSVSGTSLVESFSGSESENEIEENDDLKSEDDYVNNKRGFVANLNNLGSGDAAHWPIRLSLFPNIPPYIRFNSHDSETEFRIPNGKKYLKWKLSTITPLIVRKTLSNSGFVLVRKSNQWLGTWGKHMKSPVFRTLKDMQKLNHFPGTFQLGRKDRLWRNFQRMIGRYGLKEFGFLPHTYVLPQELKALKQNWEHKNGGGGEMWIIKPPASARGVGIKVINKWSQLPKKTSLVVQKYISNPYLINGSKFDLRLYVLVTSFHPLRIYLWPDGLARFASIKYSDDAKDLKDVYRHLTNYSINKLSNHYTANEDANACKGHKWTLSKLFEYLENDGINTTVLWRNLQQLVIKTVIACEPPITQLCEENMNNMYNCYELFGVDVLLDEDLKPWLLEVNISPSLHSSSPLDAYVKGPLVQTLFDLAQFHLPLKLSQTYSNVPPCFNPKLYTVALTKKERDKQIHFTQYDKRNDYLEDILKDLTGDDVRQLTRAEDEYTVKGKFERIFPTTQSYKYLNFMEPRYYNKLFDAWENKYGQSRKEGAIIWEVPDISLINWLKTCAVIADNKKMKPECLFFTNIGITILKNLCADKVHLKTAPQSTLSKSYLNMIPLETNGHPNEEKTDKEP